MRTATVLMSALLAAGAPAGCRNGQVEPIGQRPPAPVDEVDSMLVQVGPGPVNWDGRPGADGLEVVTVFFKQPGDMPVTVNGMVQFQLYEGILHGQDFERANPLRTWRFSGLDLEACRARSAFGWGYVMQLGWGAAVPATSTATLVPAYLPPSGRPVWHEPIVVNVTTR